MTLGTQLDPAKGIQVGEEPSHSIPSTKTIWFEEGDGWSNHWAELQDMRMVITQEPGESTPNICTESRAVH